MHRIPVLLLLAGVALCGLASHLDIGQAGRPRPVCRGWTDFN